MKIVVCAKFVPDATADRRFRSEDNTVDRAGVDGLLSELDEYAVETALTVKEAGDAEVTVLTVGPGTDATLAIDHIDRHGLHGELTVTGLVDHAAFDSLPGAEADVLSDMTFGGSPLRVYLGFVAVADTGGEALALVALYDDHRVEVRLMRGGTVPLYGIYALDEGT